MLSTNFAAGAVGRPLFALLAALALLSSPTASAQQASGLTAEALIGDSVSNPNDERYSDVAEAIKRFSNRDQLSARTFLERAVQKNPKLPPVGVLMAKMYALTGAGQSVRPALERAVQEDSGADPEPYLILAEQALAGQRSIEAEALFDKAVQLIEDYDKNAKRKRRFKIRAYQGRAVIAQRRRNWEQAEADLRAVLAEDPDSAAAHNTLGQVLFQFQEDAKDREGFSELQKAKQLNDDLPSPYVAAALLYNSNGKTSRAMEAFEKAYSQAANEPTTIISYAQALLQSGQIDKAKKILERGRKDSPNNAAVWLLSGVAARMSGDASSAEQLLMRALGLTPTNRDVLNQLALTLTDSSEDSAKARGLQFARMNQQLYSDNPDTNITLAWVLYQNGDARNATNALRAGVQAGSMSPNASYLLAKLLLARNDKDNARKLLKSALESSQGIFVERKEAERLLSTL